MWAVIAWLAGSKIGRFILGVGIIAFFIFSFRMWLGWHDASVAKQATAQMVTKFERDALAAQLERERQDAIIASQSLEEHRKRLLAAQMAEQAAKDTLESEIRSYELQLSEKNRACAVTAADRDWLLRH
ncbi:hypothetical protein HJB80_02670 [Rhizobium lentis]|uniref:hypothetical protein n=1 Tax=Rhizobium lentis TaxID=1138194 RepID=UPI001C82DF5D|nr:hypothetical protein [Rhizobium lentis]MBX5131597.1 hypothetical protein [Rhizobium lentis]